MLRDQRLAWHIEMDLPPLAEDPRARSLVYLNGMPSSSASIRFLRLSRA
jgi:hypothetical protein